MPADPKRVESLFNAALALPSADRAALLAAECAADAELRGRVERLLAAHEDLDSLPGDSTSTFPPAGPPTASHGDSPATEDHEPSPEAGTVIAGRYKLIEEIGEGGMGTVWMAQQTDPVKRFVAVKLVKLGMDTRQVLARFEAERQALALMDHPNIAKVLDAGATPDGRPFFVMELVKGVPITKYCDDRKLTPRQRLELFLPICQAIQHAHQKGVIHRDIKPSNVLVALYDDRPVPKVIDFGVAKAAGQQLTEKTLATGFGAVVGTPEYMSPEQASFNNLDIDTRSDVYALGVLLYELLSGSPPFARTELDKVGLLEIFRVIREQEPPRPSAKLSTADALPTLSANRGTEPKRLTALLRGELDWIVMKALEKDRARRYETASGFAADVQRYLTGEPVQAVPPSAGYRLRKFYRRNRVPVWVTTVFLLLTWGAATGVYFAYHRAVSAEAKIVGERDEAERQRGLAESNANRAKEEQARAEGEKQVALAMKNFLLRDLLRLADLRAQVMAGVKANPDLKVRELVSRAAREIEGKFSGQPLVEAEVRQTIGEVILAVGAATDALPHFERARQLFLAHRGPEHPDTEASEWALAVAYVTTRDGEKARALMLPLLARGKARAAARGDEDARQFEFLGHIEAMLRSDFLKLPPEETLASLERMFKSLEGFVGDDPEGMVSVIFKIGRLHLADQHDQAYVLFEQWVPKVKAAFGPEEPATFEMISKAAEFFLNTGAERKVIPVLEECLLKLRTKRGDDDPATIATLDNLVQAFISTGQAEKAVPLLETRRAWLKDRGRSKGDDSVRAAARLSHVYWSLGDYSKTAEMEREVIAWARTRNPPDPQYLAGWLEALGRSLTAMDRAGEAEPVMRECLAIREKTNPNQWEHHIGRLGLGKALLRQKKFVEAEALLLAGYEGMTKPGAAIPAGGENRLIAGADSLVELYTAMGSTEAAAKWRGERAKYPFVAPMPRPAKQ